MNLGESHGSFAIGFVKNKQFMFPELDPRIGHITLETSTFDFAIAKAVVLQKHETASISPETTPQYFGDGSPLLTANVSGFMTFKDPSEVVFKNVFENPESSSWLQAKVNKCVPENLADG